MARIRSVKPDFFTSETVARLPISARLTFIGLWTHVDDNGVCVLNEMLITAALYPLDGDPLEALGRVREDLRRLSGESLVTLYRHAGKRYLFVNSWDEHQKVSHPGKKRYPRPDEEDCKPLTSEDLAPPVSLARASGGSRETLRPEQGAGSREQGAGSPPTAAERRTAPPPPSAPRSDLSITQRSKRITDAYALEEPMCKWPAINGVVIKALKAERWTDDEVLDALLRLAKEGRSVTVDTLRIELDGLPAPNGRQYGTPGAGRDYQGSDNPKFDYPEEFPV